MICELQNPSGAVVGAPFDAALTQLHPMQMAASELQPGGHATHYARVTADSGAVQGLFLVPTDGTERYLLTYQDEPGRTQPANELRFYCRREMLAPAS